MFLIFLKFLFIIYFWLCWVFIAMWIFSSCGKWGLLSSCSEQTFLGSGFSYCGAWALGRQASSAVACAGSISLWLLSLEHRLTAEMHGVSCSMACGFFLHQRSNPMPPTLAGNSLQLNHQEVLKSHSYTMLFMLFLFFISSTYLILNKSLS